MRLYVISIILCIHDTSLVSSSEYVGCQKTLNVQNRCLNATNKLVGFKEKIVEALANGTEWLRYQQTTSNGWIDTHTAGWIIQSLVLNGYVHDNEQCSETITDETTKATRMNLTQMTGGRLAMVMLGLRATCGLQKTRSKTEEPLAQLLLKKMREFPKKSFNNFYQYSLGIIALHVNGELIPDEFGKMLLKGVFIASSKNKISEKNRISDTEAIALVALQAISKEKFKSHWTRKRTVATLRRARKLIQTILKNNTESNRVTRLKLIQVFNMQSDSFCEDVLIRLLKEQLPDGSFNGQLLTTSYALSALSGRSILDLKDLKCSNYPEIVDKGIITRYVEERKSRIEEFENKVVNSKKKDIQVTVIVEFNQQKSNGTQRRHQSVRVQIKDGESALDALEVASKINNCFQFTTKLSAWGRYITKLCNLARDISKRSYWALYINGQSSMVGADSYKSNDNDVIKFTYKKY